MRSHSEACSCGSIYSPRQSVSSVTQFRISRVWFFVTLWTAACQASLSNSWSLIKLLSLSQWCHPTISPTVVSVSSCLQSFPASGSFPMSRFFASGGQSIGVSASTSVLPMNIQDWFPLGWNGWISLQSKGLSIVFNTTVQASVLWCSASFTVQLSNPYMTTEKTIALTRRTVVSKVMSLPFNMPSRLDIAFLPRSSHG